LTPVSLTRVMIDISIVTEMTPISSNVVAAFLLLGFLKAGTPLEMASTPVRAALPEEKARSSRKIMANPARPSEPGSGSRPNWALSACGKDPVGRPVETEHRHADDADHERVRREREGESGLRAPTQVHRGEQHDQCDRDRPLMPSHHGQAAAAFCTARRDRHRDGQHVVDQQRTRYRQACSGAEVDVATS
jgi:hypothetical protein